MNLIENISRNIYPLEEKYLEQAKVRLDRLIKPTGSLGKMEKVCAQLAGIYGKKYFDTSKKYGPSFSIHTVVLSIQCDNKSKANI